MAEIVGPEANEFLLEVQKASAASPWNIQSPSLVSSLLVYISICVCVSVTVHACSLCGVCQSRCPVCNAVATHGDTTHGVPVT